MALTISSLPLRLSVALVESREEDKNKTRINWFPLSLALVLPIIGLPALHPTKPSEHHPSLIMTSGLHELDSPHPRLQLITGSP